jgi:hypothetical protein
MMVRVLQFLMKVSLLHQIRHDGNSSTELTPAINMAEQKHKDRRYINTAELHKWTARGFKVFAKYVSPGTISFCPSFIFKPKKNM